MGNGGGIDVGFGKWARQEDSEFEELDEFEDEDDDEGDSIITGCRFLGGSHLIWVIFSVVAGIVDRDEFSNSVVVGVVVVDVFDMGLPAVWLAVTPKRDELSRYNVATCIDRLYRFNWVRIRNKYNDW